MLQANGTLSNRQAIVRVSVEHFVTAAEAVSARASAYQATISDYPALIDTGAQRTCIGKSVVTHARLLRRGKRQVQNVSAEAFHNSYIVQLGIWCVQINLAGEDIGQSLYRFADEVEVIDIADRDRFVVILGMDILERCDFHLEHTGAFRLIPKR